MDFSNSIQDGICISITGHTNVPNKNLLINVSLFVVYLVYQDIATNSYATTDCKI